MTPAIGTTIYFAPHLFGMPYGPCKVVQNWPGEIGCVRLETGHGRCTVPLSVFDRNVLTVATDSGSEIYCLAITKTYRERFNEIASMKPKDERRLFAELFREIVASSLSGKR